MSVDELVADVDALYVFAVGASLILGALAWRYAAPAYVEYRHRRRPVAPVVYTAPLPRRRRHLERPGLQTLLVLDRLAKEWAAGQLSLIPRTGQAGLPLPGTGLNRKE